MAAFIVKHGRLSDRILRNGTHFGKLLRTEGLHTCCNKTLRKTLTSAKSDSPLWVLPGKATESNLNRKTYALCGLASVRFNSTLDEAQTSVLPKDIPEGYIPEPPPVPTEFVGDVPLDVNALGEMSLASQGLGHWTPPGMVQMALDFLHADVGLPWWGAIVAGTIVVRVCLLPLVVLSQRNAANMNNHMPTISKLQDKFSKARLSGNQLEAARAGHELMEYSKRNNVSMARSMMVPLAQLPIFISVFVGLRQMANLPVESMRTGGILWFTDLTVPDPFFLLPIMTMSTFLITIELGVDGMKAGQMGHTLKWAMRAMPVIMTPLLINFPTAMLCYWFSTNLISLVQVLILKIPRVREFLKIPKLIKHEKSALPEKKKFMEGFKDTWQNSRLMAQVEDRQRLDAVRFKEAGTGPMVKTYSYDPTKGKRISAKGKKS